jgi:hypothetical protein
MIRFYLLPIERISNARGPKYFKWRYNLTGIDCVWSMVDYGSIDMCVQAADITQADHDALILNADVYAFPENLDPVMTLTERSTLNTYIEAHGIPGDWLKSGDTFRSVLRTITAMMLYLQRALAILGYPTDPFSGYSLNTRYNQLPTNYQNALSQAANSLGYAWDVAANDQVRKIWKMMADQWGSQPILFGIVTL